MRRVCEIIYPFLIPVGRQTPSGCVSKWGTSVWSLVFKSNVLGTHSDIWTLHMAALSEPSVGPSGHCWECACITKSRGQLHTHRCKCIFHADGWVFSPRPLVSFHFNNTKETAIVSWSINMINRSSKPKCSPQPFRPLQPAISPALYWAGTLLQNDEGWEKTSWM